MRIRTIFCTLSLPLLLVATAAGQSREVRDTFQLPTGGTIELKNYKGSIEFEAWGSDQVQVRVRIEPPEGVSAEDAELLLDHSSVDMGLDGDRLVIRSEFDRPPRDAESETGWSNPFFHFRISAPARAAVKIEDYKSEIQISGFRANVALSTYKGVVHLIDLAGPLELDTYKGTVEIDRFRGAVEVQTYKGDVVVSADELTGDSKFQTHKGTIELVLSRAQGVNVEARIGSRGSLASEFELAPLDDSEEVFEGKVGGGGPKVTFGTEKGKIYLGNTKRTRAPAESEDRQVYVGADRDEPTQKHRETRELRIAAARDVIAVDGKVNGGISVSGWDQRDILVRVKIETRATSLERAEALAASIEVDTASATIEASEPESNDGENVSVSYEIFAPRRSNLDLKAHNGGIAIDGITGQMDFSTTNGGISLVAVAGDVRGRTTNGGLDIVLTGREWNGHGLDVETTNGGISIAVPENYSAELESGTVNGTVQLDFPITVEGKVVRKISTSLGRGGRTIRAVTTNGGVILTRQTDR